MSVLLVVALSVVLGAPFGEAEARALEADTGMTVEVAVTIDSGRSAVLARTVAFAGELPPVALVAQGGGRWVGELRFSGREDVQIAFEAIKPDGTSDISELLTLTDLGVDPAVISPTRPTTLPAPGPGLNWWLVGGIAAGVAAVGLLVWWAFSNPVDKRSEKSDNTADVDQSDEEPGA